MAAVKELWPKQAVMSRRVNDHASHAPLVRSVDALDPMLPSHAPHRPLFPLQDRQATVRHIFRFTVFCQCREIPEHAGIVAVHSKACKVLGGASGGGGFAHGAPGTGGLFEAAAAAGMGGAPGTQASPWGGRGGSSAGQGAPFRPPAGRGRGRGRGNDASAQWLYKTVRICGGMYKVCDKHLFVAWLFGTARGTLHLVSFLAYPPRAPPCGRHCHW